MGFLIIFHIYKHRSIFIYNTVFENPHVKRFSFLGFYFVHKAKSQAKDKRAKDRQKYAALRYKVGVAPPGFEVRRKMSRVAFRVFPAGQAGDTRAAICAISCFVSRFRVCVCM
jgi:hypothetical protein